MQAFLALFGVVNKNFVTEIYEFRTSLSVSGCLIPSFGHTVPRWDITRGRETKQHGPRL